ncbi:hypothetical protein [Uliginosibacterium sediminicola]|uniref:ER-bound oxygenase mpaB/mpaB'/Rubber oxygenase catalytic domain-containing protein n=1 Tax=Uliginosibacterium sediminicola TaxID=2024550 RepID=A0ABU9Z0I7_9RHOO
MPHRNSTAQLPPKALGQREAAHAYHWVSREIARLSAERDAARLWALGALRDGDELFVNLAYAEGMPCRRPPSQGGMLLSLRARSTHAEGPANQQECMLAHFWRWFDYGLARQDLDRLARAVQNAHLQILRGLPTGLSEDEACYALACLATGLHRARTRIGLDGLTPALQQAAYLFWLENWRRTQGTDPAVEHALPDFQALLNRVEITESCATPPDRQTSGTRLSDYLDRQLARLLWPLGRQLLLPVQGLPASDSGNPLAAWLRSHSKRLGDSLQMRMPCACLFEPPRRSRKEQAALLS